jgi:ribonuclease P protein component
VIGRIVCTADFERVLRTPPRARSEHFAVHHLASRPTTPGRTANETPAAELSTGDAPSRIKAVDDLPPPDAGLWLGTVVPKRHARRSVTRGLIKRQIRAHIATHREALAAGLWVVRLRAPFDRTAFPSAASAALRGAAGAELGALLARAAARSGPR